MDTTGVTITGMQGDILGERDLFMEVFNGEHSVYLIFMNKLTCRLKRVSKPLYEALTAKYFTGLSSRVAQQRDFPGFLDNAHQLFDLLFDGQPMDFSRLTASLDGQLFPMESLVVSRQGDRPQYLLENSAVRYAFSARYLTKSDVSKDSVASNDFLGMAPVRYPHEPSLAELLGSDGSLERISDRFGSSVRFKNDRATRAEFFSHYYNCKIVQLYTHGSDSSSFGEPVIYFSDSSVLLSDLLFEHNPATRLVVLSACRTGNGTWNPGEGVFSFSRGFAALGIPSSLTNLWSVEDAATYKLTEAFQGYLADGLTLDGALQKAKLDFLATEGEERRMPYFWAAQILSGRTDPTSVRKPLSMVTMSVVLGLLALLLALFVVYRKMRANKRSLS
jgi:hypothetical protein